MMITIMFDSIIMHRSINLQNSEQLYRFKWNKLTYLGYDEDCFNKEECDFKVKIVVGM